MASFAFNNVSVLPQFLFDGESGFIGSAGSLQVSGVAPINAADNSSVGVTVLGAVFAYDGAASALIFDGLELDLYIGPNGFLGTDNAIAIGAEFTDSVRISNQGTVYSPSIAMGLLVGDTGGDIQVTNTGSIEGGQHGLVLNTGSGLSYIENHGIISGDSTGVTGPVSDSSGNQFLYNFGTVSGQDYAYFGSGDGRDYVLNAGIIVGDVFLGPNDADDVYYGRDGTLVSFTSRVLGIVDAGGGDDRVFGGKLAEILIGGSGNDAIFGGGGDDFIDGGSDNDMLAGEAGADTIDGGTGRDRAIYSDSSEGVDVNLGTGAGIGGDAQGDTLLNIEDLTGSDFDDLLVGDDQSNAINGGNGDDLLLGYAGTDFLQGDSGADVINGGDGIDFALYRSSNAAVFINLANNQTTGGHATGDTLVAIEGVEGSIYNDRLTGSLGGDRLYGGAGNDIIKAFRGDDFIRGDAGADAIFYIRGDGADTFFDFEDDIDTVVFQGLGDQATVFSSATQSGANVNFAFGAGQSLTVLNATIAQLMDDTDFI